MASSQLVDLPPELLAEIVAHLHKDSGAHDLDSLRLCCKRIEGALFGFFARSYFTELEVMRHHTSLQHLVDISKSRLGKCVTKVILDTATLQYHDRGRIPAPPFQTEEQAHRHPYVVREIADHEAFLDVGRDREMLTEAFMRLPNLTAVGIQRNAEFRIQIDDSLIIPVRIGWLAPAILGRKSLCSPTRLGFEMRAPPINVGRSSRTHSRGFQALVYALGRAGVQPKALEIFCGQGTCFAQQSMHIATFMEPVVLPMLSEVKELSLGWIPKKFAPRIAPQTEQIEPLLKRPKKLRRLHLDFSGTADDPELGVLNWMVPGAPGGSPVSLPHLRRLSLTDVSVSHAVLARVVVRFAATLSSLDLAHVSLGKDPADAAKPEQGLPQFAEFLGTILPVCGGLTSFSFSHIKSMAYTGPPGHVFIVLGKHYKAISYAGPDAQEALSGILWTLSRRDSWTPYLQGRWDGTSLWKRKDEWLGTCACVSCSLEARGIASSTGTNGSASDPILAPSSDEDDVL